MTTTTITEDLHAFLDATFPGSTIHDGYEFVSITAPVDRMVRHDQRQRVADRICAGRGWLVAVGVDPRPWMNSTRIEEQTTCYNPDWNVQQYMPMWIAEIQAASFDLGAMFGAMKSPGVLALISADYNVALHARRLFARSDAELARFAEGLEDCFAGDRE